MPQQRLHVVPAVAPTSRGPQVRGFAAIDVRLYRRRVTRARRSFSIDFKAQAVARHLQHGTSLRELAEDLGVRFTTIGKWVQHPKVRAAVEKLDLGPAPAAAPMQRGLTGVHTADEARKDAQDHTDALRLADLCVDLERPSTDFIDADAFSRLMKAVEISGLPDQCMPLLGLPVDTWRTWIELAESGDRQAALAVVCLMQARAMCVIGAASRVKDGGRGWQGSEKALKIIDPQRFGGEKAAAGDRLDLSDEQLMQILRLAA